MKPGTILAFVRPEGDNGPILSADGSFLEEVHSSGWDISDHDMPKSTDTCGQHGLLVLEGWVERTGGPDPDTYMVGEWRRLTHYEMCRVRHGMPLA